MIDVDSVQYGQERSEDAVNESAQQVAFADKVLLNKVDACSEPHLQAVEQEIRGFERRIE